jgi:hypothetical protein
MPPITGQNEREELPLSKAAQYLLDECRMVLPGIQALFGFQLIAVFSPGFAERLDQTGQRLHLVAIALITIAIAIIMTPAALHRRSGGYEVTGRFVRLSTRLLLWSMFPLAVSICLDVYLIAGIVVGREWVAALAGALLGVFILLWFVLPRSDVLQTAIDKQRE